MVMMMKMDVQLINQLVPNSCAVRPSRISQLLPSNPHPSALHPRLSARARANSRTFIFFIFSNNLEGIAASSNECIPYDTLFIYLLFYLHSCLLSMPCLFLFTISKVYIPRKIKLNYLQSPPNKHTRRLLPPTEGLHNHT
jgi:hypothetical protein